HRHSGMGLHTPYDSTKALPTRSAPTTPTSSPAPGRPIPNASSTGKPQPPKLPEAVWIYPPDEENQKIRIQ
ncbi:MAG: hypothetical protein J2P17_13615, partial [Mycobacterium sp.]|nr:hypothetical protein [Mycobacterium sp.]